MISDKPYLERSEKDGVVFARDLDQVWRYMESWIPVPGARDITLTERFHPKFVVSATSEVERVIVKGEDIEAAPELLGWCLGVGTPIRQGSEVVEVIVPFADWDNKDRVPGELFSPEHEGTEAEQQVAAAEREFREAEQQLERAAEYRAEVLRRHAPEMTRQEARTITGLSVGRIQQLIKSEVELSADGLAELDGMLMSVIDSNVARSMDELVELAAGAASLRSYPPDLVRERVEYLEQIDWVELTRSSGYCLTVKGRGVVDGQPWDLDPSRTG